MSGSERPVQTGTLTRADAADRAALVSDVHYTVVLDLTRDEREFDCRTTIRFRAGRRGITFLDYAGRVIEAWCNGVELSPDACDGTRIQLQTRPGENTVEVIGRAAYSRTGAGLHRFTDPLDGAVYLHTKFEPFDAHQVYPCFDQPDLKAPFELEVRAPQRWQVIANSPARESSPADGGGTTRWRFPPTRPLSTYLTALAAGPFHRLGAMHRGTPLALWCRGSYLDALKKDADELFELTGRGLDYYTALFDRPYPFDVYQQVFVPEYAFGAMEHPGCVTLNERFVFRSHVRGEARRRRAEVVLHEMAHMWFGDLVTMRWWDDLWLNESFATLMAAMAQDALTGFGPAWVSFAHQAVVTARHADQLPTSHPVVVDAADTDAVRLNFDPLTYKKGAAVLRQLALELGEDTFIRGVRHYLARHAWGNAELADFLGAQAQAAGRDLDGWARHWLRRAGVSTVRAESIGSQLRVTQELEPGGEPRPIRTKVGCYQDQDGQLRRVGSAEVGLTGESAEVAAPLDRPDLVLANDDGAGYLKVRLDPRSRRTALDRLSALPDPMARAVIWGALWDDVMDARLPAGAFVGCVLDHCAAETDLGVLQALLERAARAAVDYAAPDRAPALLGALYRRACAELDVAPPGDDRQLVWGSVLATAAGSDATDLLRRLVTGNGPWSAADRDHDLCWRLLERLAVVGQVDDELLAAWAATEPDGVGQRRALSVRAARSTLEAKQWAWARMLDPELSLAERRAVMAGWQQPGQEELLAPWTASYFDALEQVGATESPDAALAFCRAVYPRVTTAEREVLARTDAALREGRLSREMVRVLREESAELVRRARARSAA
jgi:aminopeptidase N